MACKLGLQDVSYDPELHTGEVDFDFFDGDSPVKEAETKNNNLTMEAVSTKSNISNNTANITDNFNKDCSSATVEGNGELKLSKSQMHSAPSSDDESSYHRDLSTGNEPDYGRCTVTESEAESSAAHESDSAPDTERLQAVVRDVTAIQESLHQLRLSAGTSRTPQHNTTAVPAPSPIV